MRDRHRLVGGSFVFLLMISVVGCGPSVQQNMRKASLGVLEAVGAVQDTEIELFKLSQQQQGVPISPAAHRAFSARLEQALILGRDFNRTAWLYPAEKIALEQAQALTASLGKLAADVVALMPEGEGKTKVLLLITTAQGVISTALVMVMGGEQ